MMKELSLEFIQLVKSNAGSDDDDISLRLVDIVDTAVDIGMFLNPINIIGFIIKLVAGKIDLNFNGEPSIYHIN